MCACVYIHTYIVCVSATRCATVVDKFWGSRDFHHGISSRFLFLGCRSALQLMHSTSWACSILKQNLAARAEQTHKNVCVFWERKFAQAPTMASLQQTHVDCGSIRHLMCGVPTDELCVCVCVYLFTMSSIAVTRP